MLAASMAENKRKFLLLMANFFEKALDKRELVWYYI